MKDFAKTKEREGERKRWRSCFLCFGVALFLNAEGKGRTARITRGYFLNKVFSKRKKKTKRKRKKHKKTQKNTKKHKKKNRTRKKRKKKEKRKKEKGKKEKRRRTKRKRKKEKDKKNKKKKRTKKKKKKKKEKTNKEEKKKKKKSLTNLCKIQGHRVLQGLGKNKREERFSFRSFFFFFN